MKLEKIALWNEQTLFTEQENSKLGYLGFVRGVFRDETPDINTGLFNVDSETQYEYDTLLCFLSSELGHYLLKSKSAMEAYCREHLQCHIPYSYNRECWGFRVLTENHIWYIACTPWNEKKQFCIYAYDRSVLMRELAKARELPEACYALNPFDGTRIRIRFGETGFEEYPQYGNNKQENETYVAEQNKELKVSKQQTSAMIGGVIYGWESPMADILNYDKDGYYAPQEAKNKR